MGRTLSVKVLDAGGKLMLSGDLRAEVEASLDDHVRRGAKVISAVQKLGTSWVAACTLPTTSDGEDGTTLGLGDLSEGIGPPSSKDPEFDDHCTVEEFGFKRIITGPTKRAVELRIAHLRQFGADLIGDIELVGDKWTAVVDTGGADKAYRW